MLEIQSFNKNGIIVTTKGCSLFGRVSTIDYIYINYWARIEICSTHTRHSVEFLDRLFLFKEHMRFVEYHSYFCTIKLHYANFGDGFNKKFIIDLTKSLYIYNHIFKALDPHKFSFMEMYILKFFLHCCFAHL